MPPFNFQVLIEGIKERIESIISHGDRVFLGTNLGNLHIYSLDKAQDGTYQAALEEVKRGFSRRSIDQLGFIKDIYTLVSLSDTAVNLHPLPDLSPTQTLVETRGALCFSLDTSVLYTNEDGTTTTLKDSSMKQTPTVVTLLAVGCKRRIIIYSWKDGQPQGPAKELALPHSPRAMAFPTPKTIAMAYTQTEHAILYMETMSIAEVTLPTTMHPSTSAGISTGLSGAVGLGMNAFSGLGGYVKSGLLGQAKPTVIKTAEGEFVIPKDNSSVFLGTTGKPTRPLGIEWPGTPDETALVKPYLVSILPIGTVLSADSSVPGHAITSPVLQARSTLSLSVSQTVPYPFATLKNSHPLPIRQYSLRLLSPGPFGNSPLFLLSAPNDRTTLAAEGSALWLFDLKAWDTQIDELVAEYKYSEALELLESLEDGNVPNKTKRRAHIRALHAVALLAQKHAEQAINIFLELDVNPAKVVALYPEEVAGRLAQPQEKWIELFGEKAPQGVASSALLKDVEVTVDSAEVTAVVDDEHKATSSKTPSLHETDTKAKAKADTRTKEWRESVNSLLLYLSDQRRKISGALTVINIPSSQEAHATRLSEASVEEILSLPDAPPSALTPQQLFRFAQIVDTALFKSYLIVRPGLLGSLCRLDNWCEVSEVENELRARGKYSELTDLYQGKKMHEKALSLLRDLSEKETESEDKVEPTITYLQKLGPEYLNLIFEGSKWVLSVDKDRGFEIFTAENHELPRQDVADFLEEIEPDLSIQYIEYLIDERKETNDAFHDQLAELYLHNALNSKLSDDDKAAANARFITFLQTSTHYRPDRVLGLLPHDAMLEPRAILLGRLGEHKAALSIYVYGLESFSKAEDYCKAAYQKDPDPHGIFMMLLKLYLRPENTASSSKQPGETSYLQPALDLISRHSPRLDAVETLQLLPPLVTASRVQEYLCEALRSPRVHVRLERELWKARSDQVAQKLMAYETKRVKITDWRLCPQCHKRLDRSVIAVHAPRGEVTHYHCREAFSAKLKGKEKILQPTVLQ